MSGVELRKPILWMLSSFASWVKSTWRSRMGLVWYVACGTWTVLDGVGVVAVGVFAAEVVFAMGGAGLVVGWG